MAQRIIALAGRKRSGKNTFANLLCELGPYRQVAFVDPLWEVLLATNPWVNLNPGWRLQDVVNMFGREKSKEMYPEVRRLLQHLGTEGIRDVLGKDTWLSIARDRMLAEPETSFVITDLRFLDEASMIRELGGLIVKIERPGVEEDGQSNHKSEQEVAHIKHDTMVYNQTDIGYLRGWAKFIHEAGR